jgi:glycosyltransferase involved in cell wall biosynthesis
MKKIIFTVTNDLSYDQRMDRICSTLAEAGFEVELTGRRRPSSVELKARKYQQKRLYCYFEHGKLFYLEFNIRLFFYLLFTRFDAVCAIDLDTIAPCTVVARLKGRPVIYDAHEYFTEVIEVVKRPLVRKIWLGVESCFVPKCNVAYTVSESIKNIMNDKYGTNFRLIRNIARLEEYPPVIKGEKYMIYIGVVNAGRGLEQLVEAMKYIDSKLYICGDGDIFDQLVAYTQELGVEQKVKFFGFVQPDQLKVLTRNAWLGFLLLDASSPSYYYSLANKFFDYIHAGIPQITVDFPEYRLINEKYKVAELIPLKVEEIVMAVNKLLHNRDYYDSLVENTIAARAEYNWQKESERLLEIYKAI